MSDLKLNPTPSGPRHTDPEDLTLFAMQLLSVADASAIALHVEHCSECRAELAQIFSDLGLYSVTAEEQEPSAQARQRFLRQVSREKKIVPIAPVVQQQPAAPAIAAFGRSGSILSIEDKQPRRSPVRTVLGWSGWAVAASLAVATAFLYKDREALRSTVGSQTGQIARLGAEAASAHQLMDALTDPKAVRVTLTDKPLPRSAPIGGATYNPDKGTLVFLASDLDPLQTYKTYELWVLPADGSAPIPAGTFHPDERGNASVIMPNLPKGVPAKGFGVTIENEGGATSPTMPIVLAGF
jgi:hypothetical protein